MIRRAADRLMAAVPLVALALAWEAVARMGLAPPQVFPPLSAIGAALADLAGGRDLALNLGISLWRVAAGFSLGCGAGVLLGALMARYPGVRWVLDPLVGITYTLPKSALVPLLIIWLGIGTLTDLVVIFLGCLLPVLTHTYHGVQGVPPVLLWSARALGTSEKNLFWRVILPCALPQIGTGVRIALAFAFVIVIAAEMIASTHGIGKFLFVFGESGNYPYMFACIFLFMLFAYAADRTLLAALRHLLRWHDVAEEVA